MKKEMLINVLQPEECRIAILEDGVLEELYVERTSHESYVGNIYKGRIVNIEPSIQAAFVDFGVGRNGFLHVSDVEPAYYRHLLEPQRGENGGRRGNGRNRQRSAERPGRPQETVKPAEQAEGPAEPSPTEPVPESEATPALESALAAQTAEMVESAPETTPEPEVQADEGPPPERRRGRGGNRRRREEPAAEEPAVADQPSGEAAEAPPGPEVEKSGPEQPRPRFMESAERRTEEDASSAAGTEAPSEPAPSAPPPTDDMDLFFPRPQPTAEPTSCQAEEKAAEPTPEEPPAHEPEEDFAEEAEDRSVAEISDDLMTEFEEVEEAPRRPRPREGRRGRSRRAFGRPGAGRPKPLIQDIFKRGQEVLVQVIKEGIGTKGPTLSTYISIAGRYLVLMPGLNRVGVSRKITDEEQRRRLREIFHELKPPKGLGFIIRTAGIDRNKKELQSDLAYLARLWQVVVRRIRKLKAPAEIYQESDMITRTIRDTFTPDIDTIWVDEPTAYEHAKEFCEIVMPRYAGRIKLYQETEPLFHKYGIEEEIARIQQRHVPLPNGGSIVIDQTEALVAIDVNSGNFRADNSAEETAYQMNLQAAKEIARQLRLRDLGGVIVNDFIDMREEKHRRAVERALREAVKRDRARTKILKMSAFGIIEMTRQRIRPSLKRSVYQDCPHCLGTGQVKTCESMSIEVMRMLQLAAHRPEVSRIQVRVAEDVASYLLNKKRKEIVRLEESGNIQVVINGQPGAPPELLEFLCYDNNNNEVKSLPYERERTGRR
ncbi:MAG TPA: Rne/Rng family ribonuclease [Gemmataceae bacterium]|nr:Rne/Rng family ribonuclease [Gemmataceae bacterium]